MDRFQHNQLEGEWKCFPFFPLKKKKKIFRFDFNAVSKHGSAKMLFIKSPGQHIPEMDFQVIKF